MKNFKSGIQKGLGILLVLFLAALCFVAWCSYCPKLHYLNAYLPKDNIQISLSDVQIKTLNQLISKGIVISASDLYNDTIAFYSTLITWLIGILGISGIIGFIYVRSKSREEAEHEAEKAVDNYFAKQSVHDMLDNKIKSEVDNQLEDVKKDLESLEDIQGIKDSIQKIEEKIEVLETDSDRVIPKEPD